MKTLIITIALVIYSLAGFSQDKTKTINTDTLTSVGIIHKKPFVDKIGNEHPEHLDYWFKSNNDHFFIKIDKTKIITDSLDKYVNKPIQLKYIFIKWGEWDSSGKERIPVQSRVGSYIIVLKAN